MLTREEIIAQIVRTKPEFESLGINVLGIFGSYANGTPTEASDIDILIETTPQFVAKTDPLRAFTLLKEIKERYQRIFQVSVDIADKNGLNEIGREYILQSVIYV